MFENKARGGRALRIAVGITALVWVMAGGAVAAMAGDSGVGVTGASFLT